MFYANTDEAHQRERRKEPRISLSLATDLSILSFGTSGKLTAQILELSKSGLRVRVEEPVPPGTQIKVRWPSYAIFGVVRHCAEVSASEYLLGVEILEAFHGGKLRAEEHLSATNMALFLVGSLDPENARAAEAHLDACGQCKAELVLAEDRLLGGLRPTAKPA